MENPRKVFEVDQMSESYHEIFDTQMPPERAAAQFSENSEAEEALELGKCTKTRPIVSQIVKMDYRFKQDLLFLSHGKCVQSIIHSGFKYRDVVIGFPPLKCMWGE